MAGDLTKVVDETDHRASLHRIIYGVDIDVALVKEMMKDIGGLNGRLPTLFVAENEVDPVVKVLGNVVTLQGLGRAQVEV